MSEVVHAPVHAVDGWRCACGWQNTYWRQSSWRVKDHIARERRKAMTPPLAELSECPRCGASPGRVCRTASGHGRTTHTVRYHVDTEVPRCEYISASPWGPTQCVLPRDHEDQERHAFSPSETLAAHQR